MADASSHPANPNRPATWIYPTTINLSHNGHHPALRATLGHAVSTLPGAQTPDGVPRPPPLATLTSSHAPQDFRPASLTDNGAQSSLPTLPFPFHSVPTLWPSMPHPEAPSLSFRPLPTPCPARRTPSRISIPGDALAPPTPATQKGYPFATLGVVPTLGDAPPTPAAFTSTLFQTPRDTACGTHGLHVLTIRRLADGHLPRTTALARARMTHTILPTPASF
ncbi:hypothetical protein BC826DRAFT_1108941 [Russula brevipes]|nr:hypothetical protein BC826DRAFT_1108941 [Russula brevipes]